MLRKVVFVMLVQAFAITAVAQKYSTKSKKAIKSFEDAYELMGQRKVDEAIAELNKAIEIDDKFIEARLMLGDIYTDFQEFDRAIDSYEKAIAIDPKYFPNAYLNLGEIQLKSGKYDGAVKSLEAYLEFPKLRPALEDKAKHYLGKARYGAEAVKNAVPFDPKNLGPEVNSENYEYFPALTADEQTLILTRNQRNKNGGRDLQEDFYASKMVDGKWGLAMNMGQPLNTPDNNEGAQCISPDGRWMFFTACNRRDGQGSCDIYFSEKIGNAWTPPANLGPPVNTAKWESQPSIAPDGKTLYFASSRGGGKDIWMSVKNDRGFWGQPVKLGPNVNSEGTEESPFIHPDGKTMYFSSNGREGLGLGDIYISRKDENGEWGEAVNLGYPINSWNHENSLIVGASGKTAYFASDREGGFGFLDLYSFELYEKARPEVVTYMKGKVFSSEDKKPLKAKFELLDLKTGEVVYGSESDGKTGEFLVGLPINREYALNVSKDGFLFYSENFSLKEQKDAKPVLKDVAMVPIKKDERVVLKNIFFATGSFELLDESNVELKKLISFLEKNPSLKIQINGYTDNVGSDVDNQKLSENRAKSVYQYLIDKGIKNDRLAYKGFGEAEPIDTNDTEEGRANNRRTEFIILSN